MIRNADIDLQLAKSHQQQLRATWRRSNDGTPAATPREENLSERLSRRPVLLAVWSR